MATERALGLREIPIGNNLQLPQIAALASVSKDLRTVYLAWLPAPCNLERTWALEIPFAVTVHQRVPWVVVDVLKSFELTTSGLHRARV